MEDPIERQAAIDAADEIIARDESGNNDVVKALRAWKAYIKALPAAQPDQRWIPCSERLPEVHESGNSFLVFTCNQYQFLSMVFVRARKMLNSMLQLIAMTWTGIRIGVQNWMRLR